MLLRKYFKNFALASSSRYITKRFSINNQIWKHKSSTYMSHVLKRQNSNLKLQLYSGLNRLFCSHIDVYKTTLYIVNRKLWHLVYHFGMLVHRIFSKVGQLAVYILLRPYILTNKVFDAAYKKTSQFFCCGPCFSRSYPSKSWHPVLYIAIK